MNNFCLILVTSISFTLFFATCAFGQKPGPGGLKTVQTVDLQRYVGKWYEIAKYPNRFEKKCTGNVTAQYTLKANGRIEVRNECLKKNGKKQVAVGEAKVTDEITKAKLKVRFAPSFLSFLPFVWGDYWIIDLDVNYEWVAIGDPSRSYFWILCRKPTIDEMAYQAILGRVESLGFDPAKVVRTPQDVAYNSTRETSPKITLNKETG